jgi:hypothetical protein
MKSTKPTPPNNIKTVHPIFARHETFHPRYGWLKKGYDRVIEDKTVFSIQNAPVVLGVGKNMVSAIKYWSLAFKVVCEEDNGGKIRAFRPTTFGNELLSHNGWDPFLEDSASLWMLHWNLFKSPCYAPAWHVAFNEFNQLSFTADDLFYSLKEYKNRMFPSSKVSDSSLSSDISCMLRMYVQKGDAGTFKEDSLDCPFTELGLISAYSDSKKYAFNFGKKPSLREETVVAACLEFASTVGDTTRTISISRLLYDPGSPGRIFKLTENSLCESIERVSRYFTEVSITETAGIIQFSFSQDPTTLSDRLLRQYYSGRT